MPPSDELLVLAQFAKLTQEAVAHGDYEEALRLIKHQHEILSSLLSAELIAVRQLPSGDCEVVYARGDSVFTGTGRTELEADAEAIRSVMEAAADQA